MPSSNLRSFDRYLGIFVTLTSGTALYFLQKWLKSHLKSISFSYFKSKKDENSDDYHSQRYSKSNTTLHIGTCHCSRVKFRIRAPRIIRAVDIPSKIRFPRISIPHQFFEPLSDESVLSFYAVKHDLHIGIYTFCSFCGTHILFSPNINPTELLVNADCVEKSTIDQLIVTYHSTSESIPAHNIDTKTFNKRGSGSNQFQFGNQQTIQLTPKKSYFQRPLSKKTPSTSSTVSNQETSSMADHFTEFNTQFNKTISPDNLNLSDGYLALWPLLSNSNNKKVSSSNAKYVTDKMPSQRSSNPSRNNNYSNNENNPNQANINISPTIKSKVPFNNHIRSIDTPMHKQLQFHLQHYLVKENNDNISSAENSNSTAVNYPFD